MFEGKLIFYAETTLPAASRTVQTVVPIELSLLLLLDAIINATYLALTYSGIKAIEKNLFFLLDCCRKEKKKTFLL